MPAPTVGVESVTANEASKNPGATEASTRSAIPRSGLALAAPGVGVEKYLGWPFAIKP